MQNSTLREIWKNFSVWHRKTRKKKKSSRPTRLYKRLYGSPEEDRILALYLSKWYHYHKLRSDYELKPRSWSIDRRTFHVAYTHVMNLERYWLNYSAWHIRRYIPRDCLPTTVIINFKNDGILFLRIHPNGYKFITYWESDKDQALFMELEKVPIESNQKEEYYETEEEEDQKNS